MDRLYIKGRKSKILAKLKGIAKDESRDDEERVWAIILYSMASCGKEIRGGDS